MSTARGETVFPLLKTPESRAVYVASEYQRSGYRLALCLKQLRDDFRALKHKPGETILGCRTWTQYCRRILKVTVRAVRYRLAGGNKNRGRKKSTDTTEPPNWRDHCGGMPEFENDDLTPFRQLIVNFRDQEAVDSYAQVIGQKLTPKTRSIWFPKAERVSVKNIRYVDVDPDVDSDVDAMKDEGATWG